MALPSYIPFARAMAALVNWAGFLQPWKWKTALLWLLDPESENASDWLVLIQPMMIRQHTPVGAKIVVGVYLWKWKSDYEQSLWTRINTKHATIILTCKIVVFSNFKRYFANYLTNTMHVGTNLNAFSMLISNIVMRYMILVAIVW